MRKQIYILGAGVTGLAAGWVSGLPIYEENEEPGGICSSYYIRPEGQNRLHTVPDDGEAYRFEIGGGHWIFGGDPAVLNFIRAVTPVKSYQRRSAVFFSEPRLLIPYPLQNHLSYLDQEIVITALTEMSTRPKGKPKTMAHWLEQNFGRTLTDYFFGPFHESYTAGLWTQITPQDAYKSPVDMPLALQGAFNQTASVGYNVTFVYPENGLNTLAQRLADGCDVHYSKRVVQVDLRRKRLVFEKGPDEQYDTLISTLPLNKMVEMTGLAVGERPDPYTSVLVLNIGAVRGTQCPDEHWIYVPHTKAGFFRVGFYSNVDSSFLPSSAQKDNSRVSIYVERAYPGGQRPSNQDVEAYAATVVEELRTWRFIEKAEVVDPTWIDVAYTWSWPDSHWRTKALKQLEQQEIFQVGRYGRWTFQGIADSIRDGFVAGGAFKAA